MKFKIVHDQPVVNGDLTLGRGGYTVYVKCGSGVGREWTTVAYNIPTIEQAEAYAKLYAKNYQPVIDLEIN